MKNLKVDSNIHKFLLNIKDTNFKIYFKIIHDNQYIPEKSIAKYTKSKIIKGENVETFDELLFDNLLVVSQKKVENKICANYLSSINFNRVYILSDVCY